MTLKDLLNPDLFLEIKNKSVCLSEDSSDSRLKEVIIKDLPDNTWAFTLDKRLKTNAKLVEIRNQLLNKGTTFINKTCDGLLIQFYSNGLEITFCELKSARPTPQDYEYQLINSKVFIDYLLEILKTLFSNNYQIQKIRYVLFYFQDGLNNKKTPRSTPDSTPRFSKKVETMLNFPHENIIKISFPKTIANPIFWGEI